MVQFENDILGLAKLQVVVVDFRSFTSLKSYYDLKQFINKQSNDLQTSLLLYSNGSPNKNKRQKLGSIADTISDSNSAIELCNKLIHSKESSDNQVLGLKLLTFYLELYTFENQKNNQLNQIVWIPLLVKTQHLTLSYQPLTTHSLTKMW